MFGRDLYLQVGLAVMFHMCGMSFVWSLFDNILAYKVQIHSGHAVKRYHLL